MALSTLAASALAGVFSHIVYFKQGEHHLYGLFYLKLLLTAIPAATLLLSRTQSTPWTTALPLVLKLLSSYLAGIYTSTLLYRLLFHPLNKFPGPLPARLSSLWTPTQLTNNNMHTTLLNWHKRYGPIVRIGASDLSIAHPDALEIVYGTHTRCTKGPMYDVSYPATALQLLRDPEAHHLRRRVWSGAFSDRLLRGYELRIRKYRRKLLERIEEMAEKGEAVDVTKWFNLYSFDVMGDLSFGQGFESLERGEDHWAMRLLTASADAVGLNLPAWAFILIAAIPGIMGDFWKCLDFCGERLLERSKNDPVIPDVSSSLLAPLKGRDVTNLTPDEKNMLYGDARLIVIAGSDTTAATLSTIFYELVRHPEHITKLRAELEPIYAENDNPSKTEFLHSKIAHLEHLNGVINEALRLHPVVPSSLQRKTPPEGIFVDGVHIPGNMHVWCPLYTIARSELAYAQPHEFIPERWSTKPELIRHKGAFAPFSLGPSPSPSPSPFPPSPLLYTPYSSNTHFHSNNNTAPRPLQLHRPPPGANEPARNPRATDHGVRRGFCAGRRRKQVPGACEG
ncbi:cytochrome P450 [Aspergillus mulundensis]|uniref:L-ornithine-N5-monooxygenase n=1 Tax=Aspergillus mulundensis TaxID=1810919 RepID=A0A3D8SVI1_9EURO|nr:L-ornithine-N5-monooxygenase [Aspergillus mulundensis]RDW89798.1 L-ornithine-N5-monooxygenase [Aspergillus mulundensis]